MQAELMTETLNFDLNPLSKITVGSLEDLGYEVNIENADAYGESDVNASCRCDRRRRSLFFKLPPWFPNPFQARPIGRQQSGPDKPQLSEELRQYAVDYGSKLLEARSKVTEDSDNGVVEYIGSRFVSVWMREGDNFFSVDVWRDGP